MCISRHSLLLTTAVLLTAGAAQGADLPLPPPPVIAAFPAWYLRGDIGFSNQSVDSLYSDNYIGYASVVNTNKSFDAAPLFGLGIGYHFNNWLRFDVTGEYRGKANFHGLDIGAFPPGSPFGVGFAPDR